MAREKRPKMIPRMRAKRIEIVPVSPLVEEKASFHLAQGVFDSTGVALS